VLTWNSNEARLGSPKKQSASIVIVSASSGLGLVTVPGSRDDSQLTLLVAIYAFGDSTRPLFLFKNENFEKNRLDEQQICERQDHTIRHSSKTFMNEISFIDRLKAVFLPWNNSRGRTFQFDMQFYCFWTEIQAMFLLGC
jgi:hypothetical protein